MQTYHTYNFDEDYSIENLVTKFVHVCVDVYACVSVLPSVHLCVCDFF